VLPIRPDVLGNLANELDISVHNSEMYRTHWAVKAVDLYAILSRHDLSGRVAVAGGRSGQSYPGLNLVEQLEETVRRINQPHEDMLAKLARTSEVLGRNKPTPASRAWTQSPRPVPSLPASDPMPKFPVTVIPSSSPASRERVFIVHGRDVAVREEVARFVDRLGLEPVILHEQPNQGRTILTKFQEEAGRAKFAIVLLTGDDRGGIATSDKTEYALRARQNVVFEFGFFAGKFGLDRVCALMKGPIEKPSDIDGLVYVSLDADWKLQLAREINTAGLAIDPSKLLG
jgi:hypothetical protein